MATRFRRTAALLDYFATRKAGDSVAFEAHGIDGRLAQVDLLMRPVPRLIGLDDKTTLTNKLVMDYRHALREAVNENEVTSARLNLAIGLMRLSSFLKAKTELDQVKPDSYGGSDAIVQYLLGRCLDGLGRTAEADAAYRAAQDAPDSTRWINGPSIKELAEQKLGDPARKRGH